VLVLALLEVQELLGGRAQPRDLDIGEAFPFRVVELQVGDAVAGIASEEGPQLVNPAGAVAKRRQDAVDGGRFFLFLAVEEFEEAGGDPPRPLVGVVRAAGLTEEKQERLVGNTPGYIAVGAAVLRVGLSAGLLMAR